MEGEHTLTSFKRLSPDSSSSGFSLSRLFQRKKPGLSPDTRTSVSAGNSPLLTRNTALSRPPTSYSPQVSRAKTPELQSSRGRSSPVHNRRVPTALQYGPPSGYRNLTAVLRRLSTVAHRKGQLPQAYKESDFKQYWMPDENCKECYECGEKFNTFRRRHHCRLCGQIFCYRCCYLEIPGQLMGYTGLLRVCTYCHKIVCTYTQSPDMIRNLEQLQMDLRAMNVDNELASTGSSSMNLTKSYPFVSEDDDTFFETLDNRKVSNVSLNSSYPSYERLDRDRPSPVMCQRGSSFPFDAFGVCAAEADILKQDSLRELWHQIMSPRGGIELQSHRFRLKTYHNCLVASELVDWLLSHEKASTRNQAVVIGQELLDAGLLEPVPINTRDGAVFGDEYALYQQGPAAPREVASKRSVAAHNDLGDKSGSLSDDANVEVEDETLPQWFRQLSAYESSVEIEPSAALSEVLHPDSAAAKPNKTQVAKVLNLDLANGMATDEKNSELSLQVDLHHFGVPSGGEDSNGQTKISKLPLITDAPPPPLEQYVYSEGYPQMPLRPGNKKGNADAEAAISAEEIFSGAVMARRIGVDRPTSPEPRLMRDDNGERMAAERLKNARNLHLSGTLKQLLTDAGLSLDWADVVLPMVNRISEMVIPNVHDGDDMDIRQYVKFKKISGGRKSDCQLVSGVVFTKHVANKKMACALSHPRILVLSCAIDYQRNENRLASLDPLVLQEHKFLKIFVARVAALRPNVLLVEKTVSRLAQDMLLQHGITLALNVKREVIERVARCTRADVLRSMEKLSQPTLGTCDSFRVQKFILKNGDSKTLMYFDGCPPELGCTVTLRGGNNFILAKVKRIIQYLVYVAYSLRLETQFLMDEFALPKDPKTLIPRKNTAKVCEDESSVTKDDSGEDETRTDAKTTSIPQETGEDLHVAAFKRALESTYLSSSPYLKYPLPYLLTNEGRQSVVRFALPKSIYKSARLEPKPSAHPLSEQDLEDLDTTSAKKRKLSKDVHVLQPHPFVQASLTLHCSTNTVQALLADFRAQGGTLQLVRKGVVPCRSSCTWIEGLDEIQRKTKKEVALGRKVIEPPAQQKKNSETQKKFVPPASLHSSVQQVDCLDPQFHQRIAVLFSSYSSESNNSPRPCISPWAVFMEFYGRNDITLGGFLERYCFRPSYICPSPNCDVPMVDHVRYFAHGTGSVYIHMKNLESPIPGFQHTILTWSWCKECKQVTPIVPLSPRAWALSFAKYLELRFYADSHTRRASVQPCGHSLHRDHYQYFAYANMVASFKYRPIKLFETAIPPSVIQLKEERRDAGYWIQDVRAISTRGEKVFLSVLERVESLRVDPSNTERDTKVSQFLALHYEEQKRFRERVLAVEKKAASLQAPQNPLAVPEERNSARGLDTHERQALEYVIADSLNSLKKNVCEVVESWNNRLQEFMNTEKKKTNKGLLNRDGKPVPAAAAVNIDSQTAKDQGASTDGITFQAGYYSPVDTPPFGSRTPSPYPVQASTPDQRYSPNDSSQNCESLGQATDSAQSKARVLDGSLDFGQSDAAGDVRQEIEQTERIDEAVERQGTIEGDRASYRCADARGLSTAQRAGEADNKTNIQVPQQESIEDNEVQRSIEADQGNDGVNPQQTLVEVSSVNVETSQSLPPGGLDVFGSLKSFVVVSRCDGNTYDPVQAPAADRLFVQGPRRVASFPSLCSSPAADSNVNDVHVGRVAKARSWSDVSNSTREREAPSSMFSRAFSDACDAGSNGDQQAAHVGDSKAVSGLGNFPFNRVRLQKTLSVPATPGKGLMFESPEADSGVGTGAEVGGTIKRRDKVKNMISSLLPGSNYQPVDSTFPCHEHHLLPSGEKVVVVVSEKEPTSIISYALSTKQYNEQLHEIQQYLRDVISDAAKLNRNESSRAPGSSTKPRSVSDFQKPHHVIKLHDSGSLEDYVTVDIAEPRSDEDAFSLNSAHLQFMQSSPEFSGDVRKDSYSHVDTVRYFRQTVDEIGEETDGKRKEESPLQDDPSLAEFGFQKKEDKPPVEYHIKLPFSDSNTKFYCNVCFAEQFRNLRKRIFSESEEKYIRSLQRCVVWRARGGKSGSAFSKSLDDRFVIKQMSRLELLSFVEFAPHYFQYVNKALDEKRPTLLAKILGVYRIGFRNSQTNATMRQDVVVMENLFYDRKIDKTFDLKGSMRSRYVQSSGGENDVLLDENLLELIRESPIFIRPHSKTVFSRSIHNDTEFLSQQMVMDYSLLVGIDQAKGELVLGIIDFIRTFTWDKKLEMYVKSSGILGGQGKMPTVVSPELYRTRFTEAMHRYFLMVPDKWTGLGSDLV